MSSGVHELEVVLPGLAEVDGVQIPLDEARGHGAAHAAGREQKRESQQQRSQGKFFHTDPPFGRVSGGYRTQRGVFRAASPFAAKEHKPRKFVIWTRRPIQAPDSIILLHGAPVVNGGLK